MAIANQNESSCVGQIVRGLLSRAPMVALMITAAWCSANVTWAEQPVTSISLISVVDIAGDAPDRSNLAGMKKPESTSDSVLDPSASSDQTFPANIFGGISAVDWSGEGLSLIHI